jgi:hypothetical protein
LAAISNPIYNKIAFYIMPKLNSDARSAYEFYSHNRGLIDPCSLSFGEESIPNAPN